MTIQSFKVLFSFWKRNPLQLFMLVSGLALATALWVGVNAINSEARASYKVANSALNEAKFDQILPSKGKYIEQNTYLNLRREGWQLAPILEGEFVAEGGTVRIIGIDPLSYPNWLSLSDNSKQVDLTDFILNKMIFVHPKMAQKLNSWENFHVVYNTDLVPGTVLTDIGTAQNLLNKPEKLSRLIVYNQQPLNYPTPKKLTNNLVYKPFETRSDLGEMTESFHLNLKAFGLLCFTVGIFIVHSAIGLAFEQRRRLIKTLRTLGIPFKKLITLLIMELTFLAFVSGTLGALLGYLIASILLPDVAATLKGLYGAEVPGTLKFRSAWWLSALLMGLLGIILAGAGPVWRIANMPIINYANQHEWFRQTTAGKKINCLIAFCLLLISGFLVFYGTGLLMGFILLASMLVGSAMLLPTIIELILNFCQRLTYGVKWKWFLAESLQLMPGLKLALMALLLAMASNVGVSTMVSSFRLTFTKFLDQRLAAELYVELASSNQSADLEKFLNGRVKEILPIMSVEAKIADLEAKIYGARIGATYEKNWTFLSSEKNVWSLVSQGAATIINEQLALRADLQIGDKLEISMGQILPIAGIIADYGNPKGQAIISEALFASLFPDIIPSRFGVRTNSPEQLSNELINEFGLNNTNITNQSDLKQLSLKIFERTFKITDTLNIFTLVVAAFAVFMSLLTLTNMRIPQLAPAWALGIARTDINLLEITRVLVLAFITIVCAIPLGLTLAWTLLAIINVEAFGWRLPMFIFPYEYVKLGCLAIFSSLLAALWPTYRLATKPPADLLKVFANET